MSDSDHTQYVLADSGELEPEAPALTWDGEPLYSSATQSELFAAAAFSQCKGQTALDTDEGTA
jgi:hypothetical protein